MVGFEFLNNGRDWLFIIIIVAYNKRTFNIIMDIMIKTATMRSEW